MRRVAETRKGSFGGAAITILSEGDARRMTEAAGFTDVAISYRSTAGDWRIYDAVLRHFGWEEMRIVRAVRPAVVPLEAAEGARPSPVGSA